MDGYSQICISCVEELKAPSISNSNSAAAVDPAVLALFPDMQPDTPPDIITDMLLDAKEGRSGPLLQGLYAQHFSHGSALVVVPREDEQDGEDYDEEVDEVAAADLDTAAVMKERVVHRTRDGYERRNIALMIWLFDNHATCRHLIEPTIFGKMETAHVEDKVRRTKKGQPSKTRDSLRAVCRKALRSIDPEVVVTIPVKLEHLEFKIFAIFLATFKKKVKKRNMRPSLMVG